ncbi:MAG TPA: hypothetical protein VM100_11950 [Longimicrobiales bacterium]|nr:hypothetical protein [Longimicrobiales bacterium]
MTRVTVQLVFADRGTFHDVMLQLPAEILARHERIVDALREEPSITGEVYVDMKRLVAAYVVPSE